MYYLSVDEVKALCKSETYKIKDFLLDKKECFVFNLNPLFDAVKQGKVSNEGLSMYVKKNSSRLHILHDEAHHLSNEVVGYPIIVPQFPHFRTAEHLYQIIKLDPKKGDDVVEKQLIILDQTAGESAKKIGERREEMRFFWRSSYILREWEMRDLPFSSYKEKHWEALTEILNAMWYALVMKLASNRKEFGRVLLRNGAANLAPIVQVSSDLRNPDTFWSTKIERNGNLTGLNIFGKLIARLRDKYRLELLEKTGRFNLLNVTPPFNINVFGGEIETVDFNE
ncbi:hypothetical protein EI427_08665 [Flammeovirga pectinis]|uniref:Riboflavin biosynthesis intermediates N-glycosidase n=1 Tax=Flammeovirga pectinis TaxID=2494373 RepID=A0A3S9P295_9BACT|nr:hypothetical protein [Flammeovirga pectinis]AZQ62307.1 hypothetical protein EI427_08665 [Flammeovirga pectinis]